ncbi:oxidoreductase-like protein [Seminavis robusta]|uniref:Oxidoreductase-like protein n=1 Tax=Seminavis robusta TaxID=568900 RepID=A0A9N8ERP5_9STRA|nr:oxidoreductase-like protein [Seminavis robusta]|eukprot:Sro1496_g277530.1 oxidoreductase-like protein (656) ;mRNA; f:18535-20502
MNNEQPESKDASKQQSNGTVMVPQLADDGISEEDLAIAVKVLNAVGKLNQRKNRKRKNDNDDQPKEEETKEPEEDGLDLYKKSNLRPFRKALAGCLELHKRTMFNGKHEEVHYEQRKQDRSLKRQKMAEGNMQKKHIANTTLRKGRVEKLNSLKNDAQEEEELKLLAMMVPDGHVDSNSDTTKKLTNGGNQDSIKLPKLRSCYVCKVRYRDLHHFYDQLCPTCAALNWEKRHQTANLANKVAIVTGSRVKIGYQTCLKLLRAGATVVATTRFPNAAAEVYRKESDFEQWKDRLQIYGLDLRDVTGLEAFTRFLKMTCSQGIDILINNACQTIRRPRGFYVPMVEKEQTLWKDSDPIHKSLLQGCLQFEAVRRKLHEQHQAPQSTASPSALPAAEAPLLLMGMEAGNTATVADKPSQDPNQTAVVSTVVEKDTSSQKQKQQQSSPFESSGLSHSAAMSQMVILPEDVGISDQILPPGLTDINGHQLDLRTQNSWLLKMEEVSTPEVMECMFINAIAPFVLNSRLKPLMTIPHDKRPDRFIINVSAMEGKFYRYKMANHPHTNMAKAALNMMTRTSAEDLAKKHRIYMNSVDTGWINDENPLEKASKIAAVNHFQTPIDEVDAASRILDPIFSGVNGGRDSKKVYGVFLKDFRETEW